MAAMDYREKAAFEKLFGMSGGYVLNFSNRTMAEFFADVVGIDIYDEKYAINGDSKARRMRTFWQIESDQVVGKLLHAMTDSAEGNEYNPIDPQLKARCLAIAERLMGSNPLIVDVGQLKPPTPDKEFSLLAAEVRDSIERGRPEAALDRLHTFTMKFLRQMAQRRGLDRDQTMALDALMGAYAKLLRQQGVIKSDMAERILMSSIDILRKYNHVRNDQSLSHDNKVLGPSESMLILNHVSSTIRFIQSIENASNA